MTALDAVMTAIQRVLATLSQGLSDWLWFPVFVTLLVTAVVLFVRKAMPVIGRVGGALIEWLISGVGAVLLLVDLAAATVFRTARLRVPGVVYRYGDVVTAAVMKLVAGTGLAAAASARLARVHFLVLLLGSVGVLWFWNQGHCGQLPPGQPCLRPVASYWEGSFGKDEPAKPKTTKPKTPKPTRTTKRAE